MIEMQKRRRHGAKSNPKGWFGVLCTPCIAIEKFLFEPTASRRSAEYVPMKMDSVSRVLFPSLFIAITIAYWVFLYHLKAVEEELHTIEDAKDAKHAAEVLNATSNSQS